MSDEQNQISETNEEAQVSDTSAALAEEYKIGWQRALADYHNLQKETEKQRGELVRWSKQVIVEDFIPVYDNFKKAFMAVLPLPEGEIQRGWEQWKNGIGYIMKQFAEVLKNHGVEEIKTTGEKFDPRLHETVGEETAEGKDPGTILREMDGGYKMGEKVIKVAKVVVVK